MRKMYGLKDDVDSLPPMPVDGDTWSVMQSWALPTRSFLEFVMFSRYKLSSFRQIRKLFSCNLFES